MSISNQSPLRMIGALAPSSRCLAHAMTRFVMEKQDAKNILEVGAGTGAITRVLSQKMNSEQRSDVVEIYPKLASLLKRQFSDHQAIDIHCLNILSFAPSVHYDLIISSLPFNAFLPEITAAVIGRLMEFSKHLSVMSFFEYKIIQKAIPYFLPRDKIDQYYQSRALIDDFIARFKFDEALVNLNIPPAVVHYLRIDKSNNQLRLGA